MESAKSGILYIVGTPIGNLEDMTFRAVKVLKEVDLILAEDTREADKLLRHYDLQKSVIAYTDEKHSAIYPRIVADLKNGKNIALISDSGTPLISDPGFKLISELKAENYHIVPIPGASALTAALSVSGLPTDNFVFLGFLPKKKGKRTEIISRYGKLDATLVIYESPHRVRKTLQEIYKILGNRVASLANDMTKMHEKIITSKLKSLTEDDFKAKGEFVILVAKDGYQNE
jgi:16S rRNA (cytidine1402-2'-O)-methyltransferase